MIPKIIHYCWFGGADMPPAYKRYIEGWQQLHPAWDIRLWDESTSPVEDPYLNSCLKNKQWSNASNFMRLYSLLHFGGVYLDTDFMLLKSIDSFLLDQCFLGFEQDKTEKHDFIINNAIVGADPNHGFIKCCYEQLLSRFDGTEESDLSGPGLTTSILKEYWGINKYGLQKVKDITLYPTEYFYPIHVHQAYLLNEYSKHLFPETHGIHMWGRSWLDRKQLMDIIDYLNFRVFNQEQFIERLEKELAEERKAKDEVWFWKKHFEEKCETFETVSVIQKNIHEWLNKFSNAIDLAQQDRVSYIDLKEKAHDEETYRLSTTINVSVQRCNDLEKELNDMKRKMEKWSIREAVWAEKEKAFLRKADFHLKEIYRLREQINGKS